MDEQLELVEWQIEGIHDDDYDPDNKTKQTIISVDEECLSEIPLYENDMNLLKTILGCASEEDMIGSKIIGVCEGDFIRAVGSQGLYVPLYHRYYRDNSSRILSESELCELLGCFNVTRFNKDGKVIASYEVTRKNTIYYGRSYPN